MPAPASGRRWQVTELTRRSVYMWVAAIASAIQLVIAVADLLASGGHVPLEPLAGGVICGAAAALLAFTRVHWQVIDYGILAAASVSVGSQLMEAALVPTPPPARLLFTGVFLFIAGFSILETVWALVYVIAVFAAFVGVTLLRGGDVTLLGELGLCGVLIAHLSTYGRQLSVERAERTVAQHLALTDPLTGLENRRAALDRLNAAATRHVPLAAVLLDVDHFKDVNDTLGHDVGDDVLRKVARTLQRAVGPHGHVGRWGGEEFLVSMEADPVEQVVQIAERMRAAVSDLSEPGMPRVTVSIGVAGPQEAATVREMLKLADARLYRAKALGRDRVEAGGAAEHGSTGQRASRLVGAPR